MLPNQRLKIGLGSHTTFLKVVFAVGLLLLFFSKTNAQCNFEVNAGPGIDVCNGGQVNMFGKIGGDATTAFWRGGKGTFTPDRNALEVHYTPDPGETGTTVFLMLIASNPAMPNCQPQRDEIKIVVNEEVHANAGGNKSTCTADPVQMNGTVKGHAKQNIWLTNGNGKFDNPYHADALYYPSEADIKTGALSLEFVAVPFGVCDNDTDRIILTIDKTFGATTETDIKSIAYNNVPLKLNVTGSASSILWTTGGNGKFENAAAPETTYNPSGADIKSGKVLLHVKAMAASGKCSVERDVVLNIAAKNGGTVGEK